MKQTNNSIKEFVIKNISSLSDVKQHTYNKSKQHNEKFSSTRHKN